MKLDYKNYSHISFDLWLTLIKSNPEFKLKRNLLLKWSFNIEHKIEKINEVVRYYDVLCNNINEKTGLNIDTNEIYYLILNSLGCNLSKITNDQMATFYIESEKLFMNFKPTLLHPNIEILFKEITKKGKTISTLSNTGFIKGSTMRKLMSYFGLDTYFSFQIYSDEEGWSKPSFEIFNLTYKRILLLKDVKPNCVLHVGDSISADKEGAIGFGFDAKLL